MKIHLLLTEQAIHSVLPAQLNKGTEVNAINEIPTSYSFARRTIRCGYLPLTALPSGQVSTGITVVLTRTRSVHHTYKYDVWYLQCCVCVIHTKLYVVRMAWHLVHRTDIDPICIVGIQFVCMHPLEVQWGFVALPARASASYHEVGIL